MRMTLIYRIERGDGRALIGEEEGRGECCNRAIKNGREGFWSSKGSQSDIKGSRSSKGSWNVASRAKGGSVLDLDNGSVCDNAFDFHPLPISPDLYEDSNCPRTILRGCITSCTGSINIDGANSQILSNCFAGGSSNHIDSNANGVLNSLHTTKSSEERENIRSD